MPHIHPEAGSHEPLAGRHLRGRCDVKSTYSTTENGYENCICSNNINMSDEDNNHDTNYINKNDTNNHDARKLHE